MNPQAQIESPSAHAAASASEPHPAQRMARKCRFDDTDMDLFFMAALGWGPSGGLDIGQALHVASTIEDGNAESWVQSFGAYGEVLDQQADAWLQRGWTGEAGEMRLKAFAAFRSAWQFAAPGGGAFEQFYSKHQAAFATAMRELALPATFFGVPYQGRQLPGVFLRNDRADAPVVLVIGGADTCFEDLFLTLGRNLWQRGYSVALVDLPGQGRTAAEGLFWEAEAEQPIASVLDALVENFGAQAGRIALVGLSLGGYFVARAASYDCRLATVIASTPFSNPAEMFALSLKAALADGGQAVSEAGRRSRQYAFWKTGAQTPQEFLARTSGMVADPAGVTVPFLSILGGGDSPVFAAQARDWHAAIQSARKSFVLLDAASGADGHVQVNNRLRLAQECCGWLSEIFTN